MLVSQVIQVQLAGEDWYQPFLAPAAIILAGLLAAFLSWLVHRQSLDSADRQLVARFDHERELRERDSIRDALDVAAETIRAVVASLGEYSGLVLTAQELRTQLEKESDPDAILEIRAELEDAQREINASIEPAHAAVFEAQPTLFRLRMRLFNDHPVAKSFEVWYQSADQLITAVTGIGGRLATDDEMKTLYEIRDQSSEALGDFLTQAQRWTSSGMAS